MGKIEKLQAEIKNHSTTIEKLQNNYSDWPGMKKQIQDVVQRRTMAEQELKDILLQNQKEQETEQEANSWGRTTKRGV